MSPERGWRSLDLGRSRHRQALRETGTATQEGMLSVFHFLLIISNIKDTLIVLCSVRGPGGLRLGLAFRVVGIPQSGLLAQIISLR